jgi:hypothetical protein
MFDVKILSRVTVKDRKFKGSALVVYMLRDWMILRDDSNKYYRGIPVSSVVGVEPQNPRVNREKLLQAFEEVNLQQNETRTVINDGIPGYVIYYKPDGETIVSFELPEAKDNKELWIVTSFNQRGQLEIPPSDDPKDIEIRHLRPFEIKCEIYEDELLVGRDRDKEARAFYDRLETLLASRALRDMNPFKDLRRFCLEHVEERLGGPPTWVFDGDEMLDMLPEDPGLYLCGNRGTGRSTRLAGTDKLCIYVDSRFSVVVKVVNHD